MAKAMRRKGRQAKRNVPREPNGRISRTWSAGQTERAAMEPALQARQRKWGLTETQARDQRAATVVGRMALMGTITNDQYDAAKVFLARRNAYQRAIYSRPDYREPPPETEGSQTYEDFCATAIGRHEDMSAVLRDLMVEVRSPAPRAALDIIVIRDIEMPELEGDLRLALNALHRLFVEGRKKVAA